MTMTAKRRSRLIAAATAATALFALTAPTVTHAQPRGYMQVEEGVGYFYGTFEQPSEQNPDEPVSNMTLLVGGSAEAFCATGPDGPDPGSAPGRVFLRNDGSVDVKVNDRDQPIYLYQHTGAAGPDWLGVVCANPDLIPQPSVGTANLKVRVTDFGDGSVEVFNSVNGTVVSNDGTAYKVHASADLILEGGMPVGDPATFVELRVKQIKR